MSILEAVGIPSGSYYDFRWETGKVIAWKEKKRKYHYQKLGE